jgi:hypothetical protein
MMARKEDLDRYAAEVAQRFEDLIDWAMENWPNKNFPLMQSDFAQSRKEIAAILGDKLGEGDMDPLPCDDGSHQYIDMNPAPWP